MEELEQDKSIQGGFKVVEGPAMHSEEYEEGKICAQQPEAGSTVKEGSLTITVNISGGDDKMYIPSVENRDAREVLKILQDEMGLGVDQKQVSDESITMGFVVSCDPIPGTEVEKGDR